jgi:hypothetical protein
MKELFSIVKRNDRSIGRVFLSEKAFTLAMVPRLWDGY